MEVDSSPNPDQLSISNFLRFSGCVEIRCTERIVGGLIPKRDWGAAGPAQPHSISVTLGIWNFRGLNPRPRAGQKPWEPTTAVRCPVSRSSKISQVCHSGLLTAWLGSSTDASRWGLLVILLANRKRRRCQERILDLNAAGKMHATLIPSNMLCTIRTCVA